MRIAIIACWFGDKPSYFDVWINSLENNFKEYTFYLVTDIEEDFKVPQNLKLVHTSLEGLKHNIEKSIGKKISLEEAYKICDFKPFFGKIFENELKEYDFWGHTDLDVIYGNLSSFITKDALKENDIIFSGGHLSIYRNNDYINTLYEKRGGGLFDFKTVIKNKEFFAFDETTGMQKIAKVNNIKAKYGIEMIDCDRRHQQLMHCMKGGNPKHQTFYYEDGFLYRTMIIEDKIINKEISYIHIPKKNLGIDKDINFNSYFITPKGFISKTQKGIPTIYEIMNTNPYLGKEVMEKEVKDYKKRQIIDISKKSLYQIYIKARQHKAGINAAVEDK